MTIQVIISQAPLNGVATVVGNNIQYVPDTDFLGVDNVGYYAIDSFGRQLAPANVEIGVTGHKIVIVTQAQNGIAAVEDGQIRYTPSPGFIGTDTFEYTVVSYPAVAYNNATVSIKVDTPTIKTWTAIDDTYNVVAGQLLTVLDNDTFIEIPNPNYNL